MIYPKKMTSKEHGKLIATEFARLMLIKYAKGQKEHGGHLWEKEGMLESAIDEVVDLAVYLLTLKHKLENPEQIIKR